MILVSMLVIALAVCLAWFASKPRGRMTAFANIASGTWPGKKTYLADAAISTRYLLGKEGSDANHVAIAGAADIPLGSITDEPGAGDEANVNLFGLCTDTQIGVASGEITSSAFLVSAADGKIRVLPTAAGTYYIIGRSLQAAADAEEFSYTPCFPTQRVVTG